MFGSVSAEKEVNVSASEAWKLYGSLQFAKIVEKAFPHVLSKINVLQGDGSAGTVVELIFLPAAGMKTCKEKYTVVDEERRVKEAEVLEGGYLDLGFTLYRARFEVISKDGKENECITKSTIEFELKEEAAANAALVSPQSLVDIMQIAANHLLNNSSHLPN